MAPLILNLGSRWKLEVSIRPWPPYPQGNSPLPTKWKAGWASEPIWMQWMVVTVIHTYFSNQDF